MRGMRHSSPAVEVVVGIVEALNRGDVDGMLARMHPEFEWRPLESSPASGVARGHEGVRRYVEDWLGTFEDIRLELTNPAEIGDRVVVDVRAAGRGRGSGLQLDSTFCQLWTIRDEKAFAMEEHPTRDDALAAVRAP